VLQAIRTRGSAGSARWSPDGQRLLIRLGLSSGGTALDDIGMINIDGSSFVDLTNFPSRANWGPDWSPDGTRIVFNSSSRLFVMNADGSQLRKITRLWGEYPYWSPDGGLIVFMSNRCGCNGPDGAEYDIYTVRPDGSGVHRLTSDPGEEATGGWSPDGRYLTYGRDPDAHPGIWILPRDGGPVRHLLPHAEGVQFRGATWARDGSFFVYAIPAGQPVETATRSFEYRVSADGSNVVKLLDDAGGADVRPSGAGKAKARLSLRHRWLSRGRLAVTGRLVLGETPAEGRAVIIGRLGKTLPTKRLRTVTTHPDGSFRAVFAIKNRRTWRVATAFFAGSASEWSTTAFATVGARKP
jgi:tricorn protease-like protein